MSVNVTVSGSGVKLGAVVRELTPAEARTLAMQILSAAATSDAAKAALKTLFPEVFPKEIKKMLLADMPRGQHFDPDGNWKYDTNKTKANRTFVRVVINGWKDIFGLTMLNCDATVIPNCSNLLYAVTDKDGNYLYTS